MGSFGEGREMSFSIISLKTLTHTIKYFFYTLEGPMMSGLSAKLFFHLSNEGKVGKKRA